MPKRNDIKKILIIGSGPIQIGQACEFDYSGTQACKALMNEGYQVILVNSNPATIMTDPDIAWKTYVEPLTLDYLEKIIEVEKPEAVIPTLGGQTALNLALELNDRGVLKAHNVMLLGATPHVIRAAEDREIFRAILEKVGAGFPKSYLVRTMDHGIFVGDDLGYPVILRPNFTLGGGGGGIAYSKEEYQSMLLKALTESPTSEVLVETSIYGWKEFELEVMRDNKGTFVVVCTIENLDPCGVHTGDSITVAPQQTLSDEAYQAMRDEAKKILNEVGLETGGANIQFAVHPKTGERVVIEMNPRVSRSSALASKATGFPIAKIAALLAVGYQLDELKNDITKTTPCCYEPALDYVVTKIPRFAFEKFAGSKDHLSTQMRSVGEVMAIGRTFQESFQKALAALELHPDAMPDIEFSTEKLALPNSQRIYHVIQGFRNNMTVEEVYELTQIDHWFLEQIHDLIVFEKQFPHAYKAQPQVSLLNAKRKGFVDQRIARLLSTDAARVNESDILHQREQHQILPCFFQVDTCAGEFESETPYYYSTYWSVPSSPLKSKKPVAVVIGSGPNRIGQGIEFDYSCVRGVKALQRLNYDVVMINSNPETVSTDYDTANLLFFEPLTAEYVGEVMRFTQPMGFMAQLGGQTPIHLAPKLVQRGYHLLGSKLEAIDKAEDRGLFSKICLSLDLHVPKSAMVGNVIEATQASLEIGFPLMARPSYVLGGRRMEVIENKEELESYFHRHRDFISRDKPCMVDQFLQGALEVDVDLVCGEDWHVIGGIIEHIEAAGVHSGDSMGVMPPQRLKAEMWENIIALSVKLARKLEIRGLLNMQLAIKNDIVYVLEANPRSSRSVPFMAKATGIPLIDLGISAMLGLKKHELAFDPDQINWKLLSHVCVKGVVFPFKKFSEADSILGPEMKSTGETMGRGETFGEALQKGFISSLMKLPDRGEIFLSLRDKDKTEMLPLMRQLIDMGFRLSATSGTSKFLEQNKMTCMSLRKVHEGRPHCVDRIRSGDIHLVINTTTGRRSIEASFDIRRACIDFNIPCITESDTAEALILALRDKQRKNISVKELGKVDVFKEVCK
jgi:carbamoyl-phosphate synthase large subunit